MWLKDTFAGIGLLVFLGLLFLVTSELPALALHV